MENPQALWWPLKQFRDWLPPLRREVWILAAGQLLLFIGQGFTLVYASIYFVNALGFSPTQVGFAQGCVGVSGVFGRFFCGLCRHLRTVGAAGDVVAGGGVRSDREFFCWRWRRRFPC